MRVRKRALKLYLILSLALLLTFLLAGLTKAQPIDLPSLGLEEPEDVALTLQILFLLTILSLAPAIVIMVTSFTRIVVVLSFVRSALATQNMPPNQVIIALALFLAFYHGSLLQQVNEVALQPYLQGELSYEEAVVRQWNRCELLCYARPGKRTFPLQSGRQSAPGSEDIYLCFDPAFIISELKTAFRSVFNIHSL